LARFAGRFGRVYMGIASDTALAEPLPFIASWSLAAETDKIEVTAMGDTSKVYVAGLPDASGEFSGFVDDVTVQTYTAAVDGLPRRFYLYPTLSIPGRYFYGTVFADFSANASVDGAAELSSSWSAATPIQFKPV
jgi:hypothetical protein